MTFAESRSFSAVQADPLQPNPLFAEGGAILRLALPIMLIALVNMGMSVTDTVMVSRIFGADALAAVAVGSDLYSILFYFGAGVLGGLAPFYTAAVVRTDPAERARLERVGRHVVTVLALLLVPVVWWAPDWLAGIGLDQALLEDGRGYTRAMALTLVPMIGVSLYRTILTAAEQPRVFLKVTLAMLPLNAVANWVLMTGAGPVPALGPAGAGLSSFIVATVSLGVLVIVARRTRSDDRAPEAWDWRAVAEVLRVGLPIGLATLAEVGVFLGATVFAATLAAEDVAAHTLTLRTAGVLYAVPSALLQAAMVRMARAETQGDTALVRSVTTSAIAIGAIWGVLVCALVASNADRLALGLFGRDGSGLAAAGIATGLLGLLALMELAAGPAAAAAGLLRGRKDTRAPMLFTLAGYWAVAVPLGLWLCKAVDLGIAGIWIGLTVGTFISAVATILRVFATNARQRELVRR